MKWLPEPKPGTLDPTDYITLGAIVDSLRATNERLERVATSAETDSRRVAVAALSAQQTRGNEVRSKLGGHGGFGAGKAPGGGLGSGENRFSVQIVFASSGTVETFSTREQHEIIDGRADEIETDE